MKNPNQKKTKASATTSIGRPPLRFGLVFNFLAIALAFLAFSPVTQAVTPAPDGGYPGQNTAEGENALFSLTTGIDNTAIGFNALFSNTTGRVNTASGDSALSSNTTGGYNTANGASALFSNTIGDENTANGEGALALNTSGSFNTATGVEALLKNTTGFRNTANGVLALFNNTTGRNNTANGFAALVSNTTGSFNIAVGDKSGINLTTGSNNIDIGNKGIAGETNTIRVGKQGTQTASFIAGISGVTVASGVSVVVDTKGQLGTITSSARFKDAIKPMDKASEAILRLRPVTFHYKHELDPAGIPQFGLVAEQVKKVDPDLVACDDQGKPYTVRYEAVNAMLLNEFLKEHQKVQKLEAVLAAVNERLQEQDAKIDKVNHRLQLARPRPRIADNR